MLIFKKMYDIYTEAAGKTGKNPSKRLCLSLVLRDVMYNDTFFLNFPYFGRAIEYHTTDSSVKNFQLFLLKCLSHRRHCFVLSTRASSTNW